MTQFLAEYVADNFSDELGLLATKNCHCTHDSLVDYYVNANNKVRLL